MTIRSFPLTDDIRDEAFTIAKQRDDIAKKLGRSHDLAHFDGYSTTLTMNHIGAIAEVFLLRLYPSLKLDQPMVVDSAETNASDFVYQNASIEVKNHCWYGIYDSYFVNALRFDRKGLLSIYLLCCIINDIPSKADTFSIIGWIRTKTVRDRIDDGTYLLNTVKAKYAPAYEIPRNDLMDIDLLLQSLSQEPSDTPQKYLHEFI